MVMGNSVSSVITGMAWSTPLGDDLSGVWSLLCAGRTAVSSLPSPHRLRTEAAAVVSQPPYGTWNPQDRLVELTVRAVGAAAADAGIETTDPGLAMVWGTSFGAQLDSADEEPGDWAAVSARRLDYPGRPLVVSTACSAGSDSLLVADALIRQGRAKTCIAGGVDILTEAKRLGHSALGTMSSTALRAFDEDHDGTLLGEGSAFLVLESADSARSRGARIRAVLRGAGSANDAFGLTAPDPSGSSVVAAIRRCLGHGGASPDQIAVISAHGTGTAVNDRVEAAGLERVFGGTDPGPVVFGTKGALGHSLGATGSIEAVTTVLALSQGRVPPLAGLKSPMREISLHLSTRDNGKVSGDLGISLTLGFGGFNTCLLFECPDAS